MYRNAGPGPLRAYQDGSLGRSVPTSRGPGLRRAYQDGSLGEDGPLRAFREGSLGKGLGCSSCSGVGEYFSTNGLGEYFSTNGLGLIGADGKEYAGDVQASAPGTASDNQPDTTATSRKQLLIVGGTVVAIGALVYLASKKK